MPDLANLLVVLDCDECLIHTRETSYVNRADQFSPGDGLFTIKRPGLDAFIQEVMATCDVAVWSSGTEPYVQAIVRNIFPDPTRLKFIWSRSRCTERRDDVTEEAYWIKPLAKVKRLGYSLARTVIVDDDRKSAQQNRGNLVAVSPWTGGDPEDAELARVIETLLRLQGVEDVRKVPKG